MITLKTKEDIKHMRKAGKLTREVLLFIEPYVKPGVSTLELNDRCHEYISQKGAIMASLNYKGFPKSICTSINDVVCHGIPKKEDILKEGDIINIDVSVILNGYYGDTSHTYAVGNVPEKISLFLNRAKTALDIGIQSVKPGFFLTDIGRNIENYATKYKYSVVKEFGGHGIGKGFHEEPFVAHYWIGRKMIKLKPGMTFTIEPILNMGKHPIYIDEHDGWTVYTKDGSLSAQHEHTVLVTESGVEILTADQ